MPLISRSHFLLNSHAFSGITSIIGSGVLAGGSITTTNGTISAFRGNIQTIQGTVGGKQGVFPNLACTGIESLTVPDSRGIFMGLDSSAAAGFEICADTFYLIDLLQQCLVMTKGRLVYDMPNNV